MNADRVAVYTRSEVQLERLNIENGSKQQRIGARGERLARLYLRLHGYRILQRNYRVAHKEIDIIAKKGSTVAFVEVKTALDSKELPPMLRVGSAKRANMAYAAKYFAIDSRKINRTCKYGFHRAVLINNAYVLRFIYCFAIDIPIANLKPALFENKKIAGSCNYCIMFCGKAFNTLPPVGLFRHRTAKA